MDAITEPVGFFNSHLPDGARNAFENSCKKPSCVGCADHEPDFKVRDWSGRKCAAVYAKIPDGLEKLEDLGALYGVSRQAASVMVDEAILSFQQKATALNNGGPKTCDGLGIPETTRRTIRRHIWDKVATHRHGSDRLRAYYP